MAEIQEGDRVHLREAAWWKQPYNRWAQRKRIATVMAVWTPQGSTTVRARVRFDRSRKATPDEAFDVKDLVLFSRPAPPPTTEEPR